MSELERLEAQLKNRILYTCNTIGCRDCGHKVDEKSNACDATILQNKIMEIEMAEFNDKKAAK